MEILELKNKDWLKEVNKIIINQKKCIAWGIQDTSVILIPCRGVVDEQLSYNMGYMVYEAFNLSGGVILTEAGDFEIGHWDSLGNKWLSQFVEFFVGWLKSKGLNATYEDNDILVDNYKVCGTCITQYGEIAYTGIHIGINTNLENIKKLCKKPMNKIPKGLSEYGITTEQVKQMFLEFCESYKD